MLQIKKRRSATLNGIATAAAAALGEEIKAVVFSPAHLTMIKDGPAERRKFLILLCAKSVQDIKNCSATTTAVWPSGICCCEILRQVK